MGNQPVAMYSQWNNEHQMQLVVKVSTHAMCKVDRYLGHHGVKISNIQPRENLFYYAVLISNGHGNIDY